MARSKEAPTKMIATSAFNRDVFDFFSEVGIWPFTVCVAKSQALRPEDRKCSRGNRHPDLESVTGTHARQRSISIMLKKKGVFDAMRPADVLVIPSLGGPSTSLTRFMVSVSS